MKDDKKIDVNSMLSNPTPEDMDAIASSNITINMNQRLIEKLSESVIDNAGLYDETEAARREAIRIAEKRRKIRNIGICLAGVVVFIGILIGIGMISLKHSDNSIYYSIWARHEAASLNKDRDALILKMPDELTTLISESTAMTFDESEIDEEIMENTLLDNFFTFCDEQDMAYDEYEIIDIQKYSKNGTVYYVYDTAMSIASKQIEDYKIFYDSFIITLDEESYEIINKYYNEISN